MRLCPGTAAQRPAAGLRQALLLASVLFTFATAELQENGLDIETTSTGDCGTIAQNGDIVSMHYTGTLQGGSVFDSSHKRNKPFEFKLGEGMVIEGWDLGLLGMCLGEERKLIIPPALAYGARTIGHIPPQSTLTFETKLLAINEVTAEEAKGAKGDTATSDEGQPSTDAAEDAESPEAEDPEKQNDSDDDSGSRKRPGAENGECRLLGPFALFVQAGLGVLALSSLVYKRWRERPRRPMKVWFFDVSKQVVGSALLHLLNIVMSVVSSKEVQLSTSPTNVQDETGRSPNPCSFYLINIAVDTTLGIPILVLFLKMLTTLASFTPLARPAESIKTGNYGHPPRATWWLKQSCIYFVGLLLMKLCVVGIFTFVPQIALIGDWALKWTEGSEALQIVFVMFVFPLIMNAIQYYIIDSFIKDSQNGAEDDQKEEDEDHESREPLHRASEYEEGSLSPRESDDAAAVKRSPIAITRDARDSNAAEREPLTNDAEERKQ